eukprot:2161780-Amphidinium_carterae.1
MYILERRPLRQEHLREEDGEVPSRQILQQSIRNKYFKQHPTENYDSLTDTLKKCFDQIEDDNMNTKMKVSEHGGARVQHLMTMPYVFGKSFFDR